MPHFSQLSEAAQTLIVDATLGVYDKAPPADIPESVKAEIAAWLESDPGRERDHQL